ncbi:MAG: RNA polymerase sigma factor [Lachnospiraceae bacterium]|nr:RNA polymerase sigma factor [Lachnospiraceae bacterium]
MKEETFAQCMSRIANGDRSALKEIYEEYLPYLYSIVYGVLQQKEEAEDVTSEVFLRIWNTAGSFKPGNGHKGYLATIARNMAIDLLRKRKREVLLGGVEDEEDDSGGGSIAEKASEDVGPENCVVQDMALREALEQLNDKEREVVGMKVLAEMTFQEIADAKGIPLGTVTWRYQAAIKKLRRCGYGERSSK